jgi:hypothetical protein
MWQSIQEVKPSGEGGQVACRCAQDSGEGNCTRGPSHRVWTPAKAQYHTLAVKKQGCNCRALVHFVMDMQRAHLLCLSTGPG